MGRDGAVAGKTVRQPVPQRHPPDGFLPHPVQPGGGTGYAGGAVSRYPFSSLWPPPASERACDQTPRRVRSQPRTVFAVFRGGFQRCHVADPRQHRESVLFARAAPLVPRRLGDEVAEFGPDAEHRHGQGFQPAPGMGRRTEDVRQRTGGPLAIQENLNHSPNASSFQVRIVP